MRRIILVLLCALLCVAAAGALAAKETATPKPVPTPFVATPSPEAEAAATRQPRGWYTVQGVHFDISAMTVQERNDLINALRSANVYDAVADIPTVQGTASTRDNPIYIGQRAQFLQSIVFPQRNHTQEGTITMAMTDVVRGAEAERLVISMNALNDLAPVGKEYVVATFDIGVTGDEDSEVFRFTMYDFQPFSVTGRALDYAFVTDDLSLLQLVPGGEGQLRVTALVEEGTQVLLCYLENIWFSTEGFQNEE